MWQVGSLDQTAVNVTLYLMIHCKDICETFGSTMGCNWCINFTFKFANRNSFLGRIWQFGPNLDQDCPTLYFMISSTFFEKELSS